MKIGHGLLQGQVLQRDNNNRGAAQVSGSCKAAGTVELRALKGTRPIQPWRTVGEAEKRAFSAEISGLRVGGPYRVELRIKSGRKIAEHLVVDDIFVGDVWVLAGQSNMEGVGNLVHAPKPHPQVRAFYMRDEWGMAKEKLHFHGEAVDRVHNGYGTGPGRPSKAALRRILAAQIKGMSPGHAFGLEMYRRTRIPQGLIPCAHGGTSMLEWSPELRDRGGDSLYGAMMRRYERLGQPLAGILWYQGESDANEADARKYTERMIDLVASTRRDMALPRLPWLVVQLGCHAASESGAAWNSIQEQQRRLPAAIERLDLAPAVDSELDDGIHISGTGQHILGRRLARVADRLVHKAKGARPGITLSDIRLVPTPGCNPGAACTSVELSYRNAVGGLVSDGRPTGFVLLDRHGHNTGCIYKTTVSRNRVLLHTNQPPFQLCMLSVSYGHGRHPVCTITDREQMSIPAMQAVPLKVDVAPSWEQWDAARLPGSARVARVAYAAAARARGWYSAPLRAGFGVLPKDPVTDQVGVYAMRTSLMAEEAFEAWLTFGANAPFKIWLNGRRVLVDLKCAPMLDPCQYRAPLPLKRGQNRLLVVFAPPGPQAHFGIFASIGTRDGKVELRVKQGA